MPHALIKNSSGNFHLASEVSDTIFVTTASALASCFEHTRDSFGCSPTAPITPGMPSEFRTRSVDGFRGTPWVLIVEGSICEIAMVTHVVGVPPGDYIHTVSRIRNAFTVAAKIYTISPRADKIVVVDPNPSCKEISTLSLQGNWRDQIVFREVFRTMTDDEFEKVYWMLSGGGIPPVGTRDEQIWDLITNHVFAPKNESIPADVRGVEGAGSYDPSSVLEDGGPHVSFAFASFEDQFEEVSGAATFDEFIWEVPFDLFLTRASIYTNASTANDGYVTITKNDVFAIVDAGPVPPNRNLPAVTGVLKGLDLANVACVKGDKITVRLNLPTLNTIKRAKVVLGYASRLSNL